MCVGQVKFGTQFGLSGYWVGQGTRQGRGGGLEKEQCAKWPEWRLGWTRYKIRNVFWASADSSAKWSELKFGWMMYKARNVCRARENWHTVWVSKM